MKSLAFLFPFVLLGVAFPVLEQSALLPESHPDFSLDLNEQRLIQLEGKAPIWVTEREKIHLKAEGIPFYDITETPDLDGLAPARVSSNSPYTVSATEYTKGKVDKAFEVLSTKEMESNLEHFTSYRTRYYRSSTGKQSQEWLLSRVANITDTYSSKSLRDLITITEFPHSWGQNSIVAKIKGKLSDDEGIVVIGAHQDSTNLIPFLPAPGADDDGSGTVTILEAYRSLLSANYEPNRTVEFHWYSAEEGGLLGSQAIAKDYASKGANIYAMTQFDMTAFVKKGTDEVIALGTDKEVSLELLAHNKKLVETYTDLPWKETSCGYACSDHGSWGKAGYPSAFATEGRFQDFSPYIHSANDKIGQSDEFSFDHMLQFAKLAVAFAAETAGWV